MLAMTLTPPTRGRERRPDTTNSLTQTTSSAWNVPRTCLSPVHCNPPTLTSRYVSLTSEEKKGGTKEINACRRKRREEQRRQAEIDESRKKKNRERVRGREREGEREKQRKREEKERKREQRHVACDELLVLDWQGLSVDCPRSPRLSQCPQSTNT